MKLPSPKRLLFHLRRVAPDVLPVVGGVMCVASPIAAAIQTHKHYEKLVEDHRERMNKIKEAEEILKEEGKEMPKKDKAVEKVIAWCCTIGQAIKTYAVPALLAVVGVAAMYYGKWAYKKDYLGVSATAGILATELNDIKERANTLLTKEQAEAVIDGVRHDVIDITAVDENGNTTTTTDTAAIINRKLVGGHPNRIGTFEFIYNDPKASKNWNHDPYHTLSQLRSKQMQLNDTFQINKFLYLNDVLEALDMDLVPDGYTMGWSVYAGSNCVDFGINDPNVKENVALINQSSQYGNVCKLKFNCVLDIRNKMYEYQLENRDYYYIPSKEEVA